MQLETSPGGFTQASSAECSPYVSTQMYVSRAITGTLTRSQRTRRTPANMPILVAWPPKLTYRRLCESESEIISVTDVIAFAQTEHFTLGYYTDPHKKRLRKTNQAHDSESTPKNLGVNLVLPCSHGQERLSLYLRTPLKGPHCQIPRESTLLANVVTLRFFRICFAIRIYLGFSFRATRWRTTLQCGRFAHRL